MLSLIILIVFGLGVAFFATQNTGMVFITLGNYFIGRIPLYVIVIGSMLLGIFVSWLVSMANTITATLRMHGKEASLKKAFHTIDVLEKDNNELRIENAHLKGEQKVPLVQKEPEQYGEDTDMKPEYTPNHSFFSRIKHSIT